MPLLLPIFALLVLSRLLGKAAEKVKQPAAVGELLTGIVVAAIIGAYGKEFPVLLEMGDAPALDYLADIAVFFLVLLVGVELKPKDIVEHSAQSSLIAIGGLLLPFLLGGVLAWAFLPESELKQAQIFLVGTAVSITAIPATVKIFAEFNVLHTRLGETVVAAAIVDDILGLFLMATLTAFAISGHIPDLANLGWLALKVILFFSATWLIGFQIYPQISKRLNALDIAAVEFSVLMMVTLAYAIFAEYMGLHWIMGVLMAGLFFEPARVGPKAYNEMRLTLNAVTAGFLGPMFFAYIGLKVELSAISEVPLFVALLILIAVMGKLLGAGMPALASGFSLRESATIGTSMSARGSCQRKTS